MTKQERIFALKISSIMAARMLGLFMIFPVFSIYADQYADSSAYLIGVAIGIYGLTQALLQIPFGYLSDRYGRKPLIVMGLLIFLLGSVIAAESQTLIGVIIGRSLQGGGAISAVLMAFLADFVSEDQRAKANAFVGVQIGLAFMLSLLIGPIIAYQFGLSGLFTSIALLSVIALGVVLTLPYVKPTAQYELSYANFKQLLKADLLRLDFSVFTLHLVLTCAFVALPLLMVQNQIVEVKDNWQLYLPVVILSFAGMIPLVILAEKLKKTKAVILLAIALLTLSQVLFYQLTLSYPVFFILLLVFFIGFNALEALLPAQIARRAQAQKRGLAMGIYSTSQFLGAFVGGVLGGWIYATYGLNSVFLLTTLLMLIWALVMLRFKQQH